MEFPCAPVKSQKSKVKSQKSEVRSSPGAAHNGGLGRVEHGERLTRGRGGWTAARLVLPGGVN